MTMRKYTLPKRLIAMLLSIVLVLSVMPSLNVTAKVVESSAVVDPSSMDTWKDAFLPNGLPSTEHAGGIWTDKSVFANATAEQKKAFEDAFGPTVAAKLAWTEKDNFLVALSALGSNSIVVGQGTQPTDTVFVLDISGSMDNTAMSAMVTAANNAIRTLMESNAGNRVGVVLYSGGDSGTITTLLPLDHYTGVNMYGYGVEHYFIYTSSSDEITTRIQKTAPSDGSSGGCGGDDNNQSSQPVKYGYPMNSKNVEIKVEDNNAIDCEGGTYIQGGLWEAWENNFRNATDTANRTPSIVLMSDGAPTYTTNQFDNVPDSNTHGTGSDSYIGDGFVTQLTAAVVKKLIDDKYPDAPAYMYTVGFGIDDIDEVDERAIAAAVLDPTGSAHTDINDLWDSYNALGTNGTMPVRLGLGNDTTTATVTKSATELTSESAKYVDKYFSADTSSDLNDAFQNIVNEISLQAGYYPTRTDDNGTNYSGYVTFSDNIGSGMEVEHIKGILVGNDLHTGRDMAYVLWATEENNKILKNMNGGVLPKVMTPEMENALTHDIWLGTRYQPTTLGDEFVWAVIQRFGITDTVDDQGNVIKTAKDRAWEVIGNAWNDKQLSYTPAGSGVEESFSNFIGWYGDASGNYLGPWDKDHTAADIPAGAEYINSCYGMLGTTNATSIASDMMYVAVQISRNIQTQEQMVTFQIPASLLPVITYKIEVELESDGSIKEDTAKISATTANPIQLLYEVGVNEDLVNELTVKNYGRPTGDGRYYLYTNTWRYNSSTIDDPTTNDLTYAYFEPSSENEHYYFTEDTPVLVYNSTSGKYEAYTDAKPTSGDGKTYYYMYHDYVATGGKDSNGKYTADVHTHYAEIVGDALASAKADGTGCIIPKGTMHANTHSHDLYKTGAPAGDRNYQGNPTETYNMVRNQIVDATVARDASAHHYELMYLGNNGRLTYAPATGIQLTKELADGVTAPAGTKFKFTITLTGDTDGSVSVDGVTTAHSGELIVELEAGETVTITDIADGATYSIKETEIRGFTVSNVLVNGVSAGGTTASGTVAAYTLTPVVFTNDDVQYSFFTVSKQVAYNNGSAAIANKLATFNAVVTLSNADNTPYANEEVSVGSGKQNTDADGKLQISIKDGEIIRISDVPVGTKYQVDEITTGLPAGYAVVDGSEGDTVVETGNGVTLKNSYTPDEVTITSPSPYITITGTKQVANAANVPVEWASDFGFTFTLSEWNPKLNGGNGGWDPVELNSTTVSDTLDNSDAYLTEADPANPVYKKAFTLDINGLSFDTVGDHYFRISETIGSRPGMTYDSRHHDFKVVVADENLDGALEIKSVEKVDAHVTVTNPSTGVWNVAADFVNTYEVNSTKLTLEANKVLRDEIDDAFNRELKDGEFSFIVVEKTDHNFVADKSGGYTDIETNGMLGDIIFEPITYAQAGTHYYLIAEIAGVDDVGIKYDGTKYLVTVTVAEEAGSNQLKVQKVSVTKVPVSGASTTVDYTTDLSDLGIDFVNTYTAKSVTTNDAEDRLTATKTLTNLTPGANNAAMNIAANDFTFKLTAITTGAPMPANAEVGCADSGKVTFGAITYETAGIYEYKISEVVRNDKGITYDTNWYKAIVVIKDDGVGNLYVDSTSYMLHDDTPVNADKVVFANTYKAEATGEIKLGGTKVFTVPTGKNLNRVLADGDFTFMLSDKTGTEIERVTNVGNTFQFTSVNFNREGTYEYVITELNDGKGGVVYDNHTYAVKIVVSDDTTSGQLTAVTTVDGNAVADDKNISVSFENSYNVTDATLDLHAHKHLQGRPMKHDEFKFTLTAKNNAPMPAGYQNFVTNGYRGHIDFGKITYTAVGEYVYIIEETAGGNNIGVTYDEAVYTVTVKVVDNGKGALEASVFEVKKDGAALTDGAEIEFTNRYKADKVTVTLEGEKLLDDLTSVLSDKQVVKNEDFAFHLKNENEQVVASDRNDENGKFKFELEYDAPATEVYWIEEVAGSIPGMTYDTTKYKVTVTVTDNLTGKLVADVVYEKVTDAGTAPATKVEFNNTYKAKETTVTFQGLKTFTGGRDLKENEFSFTLAALNGAPMAVNASTETVKNAADGKFTFSTITFTEEGTYKYELTEVKGDDEKVTYDASKYTLTVTVTDVNGELKATTAVTKGTESVEDYGFTNIFAPSSASVDIAVQKVLKNDSGKEMGLKGFKFQLVGVEKPGTVNAESDEKGEAKFTLTFTGADIGKTFTYKLSEVDTEVADVTYDETVYEIKVTVGQNKTTGELVLTVTRDGKAVEKAAEFVNTYAPAPEKEPEKDPDESPKTMDDFRLGGWLLMMSVSAVCLLAVIVLGKKFNV